MLESYVEAEHPCFNLIWQCKDLIARDWVVHFKHTYREGNRVVDWLANHALNLSLGLHCLSQLALGVLQSALVGLTFLKL